MDNNGATYKEAGVDIHAGYELVKRIKSAARSTYLPGSAGRSRQLWRIVRFGQI